MGTLFPQFSINWTGLLMVRGTMAMVPYAAFEIEETGWKINSQ